MAPSMRIGWSAAFAALSIAVLSPASAQGCVPDQAWNVIEVDLRPVDHLYYLEDRGCPTPDTMFPSCGVLIGDGTWVYYESNGVPGLQRGGIGLTGDCFPGHGTIPPDPSGDLVPCLLIDEDPITDDACGAGPDHILLGLKRAF